VDFTFSEDQSAIAKIARDLLDRLATPDRLTELESAQIRHDPALWQALADADLLGIALPEAVNGSGRGFLELAILMSEIGATVAPVPAYATLVLGADTIARHGDADQIRRHLSDVVTGERILTAALTEPGHSGTAMPATTARRDGPGWRIDGAADLVPAAQIADAIVVPAIYHEVGDAAGGAVGLFVIDRHAAGVDAIAVATTGGQPHADVTFDGVRVADEDRLTNVADGADALALLRDRALVALCAQQIGVTERALRMAAAYTSQREQFGKPIGSFQAIQQRMADAFIDVEAIRWTTWHAAWLISEGRPARREASIAKFWAAEAGMRVVATAQQVHGGIGIDVSYPLFRYFLWAKHNELALGSASTHLAYLGGTYPATAQDR
jgi:3-oxocholest-4-en-26-oyl-CoA dehydrogenase beta subunit